MGKRGTNQLRTLNVSVPADSIGFWADRLRGAGTEVSETERFGTQRLDFAHPCGIPYTMVGETEPDDREPWDDGGVPGEHAIRGAYGTTTSVREPEPMDFFLREAFNARHLASDGPHHQYEIGSPARATAASSSWSRSPTARRARGSSARARSTTTRSTRAPRRTRRCSRTTSSGSASPTSPTSRTAATSSRSTCARRAARCSSWPYGTEQGFLIDEAADELGTHMCIPPHWEDRRPEIAQLEHDRHDRDGPG